MIGIGAGAVITGATRARGSRPGSTVVRINAAAPARAAACRIPGSMMSVRIAAPEAAPPSARIAPASPRPMSATGIESRSADGE
jgi:hypothetical protein